jgi:hypothetical protein
MLILTKVLSDVDAAEDVAKGHARVGVTASSREVGI